MAESSNRNPNRSLFLNAVVPLLGLWALALALLVGVAALHLHALLDQAQLRGVEISHQLRTYARSAVRIATDDRLSPDFVQMIDATISATPGTAVTITDPRGSLLYGNTASLFDRNQRVETAELINRNDQVVGHVRVVTGQTHQYQLVLRRYAGVAAALGMLGLYLLWHLRARFREFEQSTARLTAALAVIEHDNAGHIPTTSAAAQPPPIHQRVSALGTALATAQHEHSELAAATTAELNQTLEELEIKNVELDLARQRAEDENAAKSSFLANMSHEIRSPMNGIIGHLQLLQQMPLPAEQRSYIDNTLFAAHSLLDLIDNTLHFSRIEANRLDIQSAPFNLADELHRCLIMLAPDVSRKKLDLYFLMDPALPDTFIGDSLRIRQIMANLISNAIKYTVSGSIHLHVSGIAKPGNKCALSMTVADTGLGMDSAQIESLFEAWSQAGRSPEGGAGLGLVIARSLATAMGGQLTLSSTLHKGSVFTLQLTLSHQKPFATPTPPAPTSPRVILDCDDATARSYYAELLEFAGFVIAKSHSPAVDIGLCVWTDSRIDEQQKNNWQTAADDPTLAIPHIILTGRAETTAVLQHHRTACGEVLPLHSPPQLVLAAVQALLNQNTANSQDHPQLQANADAPQHVPEVVNATSHALAGLHVLLADDDEFGRAYMCELLKRHGMKVDTCGDGLAAVHKASTSAYDLILLDLRMPEMGGVEAAQRIRQLPHTATLPIIGMTASVVPELHQQCLSAGMTDCWVKPLQIPALINGLSYWTRSGRAHTKHLPPRYDSSQEADGKIDLDQEMRDLLTVEFDTFEERYAQGWHGTEAVKELREFAHRLNGSAAICRFGGLQAAADRVEQYARDGVTEQLPQALEELQAAVTAARVSLTNSPV